MFQFLSSVSALLSDQCDVPPGPCQPERSHIEEIHLILTKLYCISSEKKTNPCFASLTFALKESKNTFLCLRVNTAVFACSITLRKGEFALNNKYRRMLRYVNDIIERLSSDFSQSPLNRKKTLRILFLVLILLVCA